MNIGILTHCIANNFGANLQALSTAYYLKNMGYTPIFLNWDSYLIGRNKLIDSRQLYIHHNFLINHGCLLSDKCSTNADFVKVIRENDIHNIIIGSDAVLTVSSWVDKLQINHNGLKLKKVSADMCYPNPFWIPFAELLYDCRFFLLSPSCQSSSYRFLSKEVIRGMRKSLQRYSFLSARDTYTADMINFLTNRDCPVTPDPVWGFNINVRNLPTRNEILEKYSLSANYVVVSFYEGCQYTAHWLSKFREILNQRGIEVYACPMPQGQFVSNLPKIHLPIDPLEWFSIIKYSRGYVGNNMHPIIVSILNSVPFFSIDQHGRHFMNMHFEKSSKVYDLLNMSGLLEYRISAFPKDSVSPLYVVDKLLNFKYDKCKFFAEKMADNYLKLMSNITSKFLNQ